MKCNYRYILQSSRDIVGQGERQRIEKKFAHWWTGWREKVVWCGVAFCRVGARPKHAPRELVCQLAELIMERVGWLSSELFARLINLQWDSLCMSALLINKHDGGGGGSGCSTWNLEARAECRRCSLDPGWNSLFAIYEEILVDPPRLCSWIRNFNYFPLAHVVEYSTVQLKTLRVKF
jgi:hypothetical protein